MHNTPQVFFPYLCISLFIKQLVIGLGPLEENETTDGAKPSSRWMLLNIAAIGFLLKYQTKAIELVPCLYVLPALTPTELCN